ncbi:thiamine phosphate synthase [Lysinibacillus sp. BF-4]|uniref:thiamine phosphate synthase n=1 Tax=Lysinibacillus sp. BF-4 TaxID=1473546 RepID=UPI0013776BA7|nr:thiamine phosphate synthase [Lysinibacillus sp. BF-4]
MWRKGDNMQHAITKGVGFTEASITQILNVLPQVDAVVLREKQLTTQQLANGIATLLTRGADAKKLIVHSAPQLAEHFQLLGCHFAADANINGNDFPFLCGQSTHSIQEALSCETRALDYIYFSHIFPSSSKQGMPPRGLQALREVCAITTLPVIALGGITKTNQHLLPSTGASGFAAISMFFN